MHIIDCNKEKNRKKKHQAKVPYSLACTQAQTPVRMIHLQFLITNHSFNELLYSMYVCLSDPPSLSRIVRFLTVQLFVCLFDVNSYRYIQACSKQQNVFISINKMFSRARNNSAISFTIDMMCCGCKHYVCVCLYVWEFVFAPLWYLLFISFQKMRITILSCDRRTHLKCVYLSTRSRKQK